MEVRKCPKCHKIYPLTEEFFKVKSTGKLSKLCTTCCEKNTEYYKEYRKNHTNSSPKKPYKSIVKEGFHQCYCCKRVLPFTDEHFKIKVNGELTKTCIACTEYLKEYMKKYMKTEKGKILKQKMNKQAKQKRQANNKPQVKKSKENGYQKCYVCKQAFLFTEENFVVKNEQLSCRCVSCTDDSETYQKYLIKKKRQSKQRYERIKDTEEYKAKEKIKGKKYRENNSEKIKAQQTKYRKEHPEVIKAQRKRYEATPSGRQKRKDQSNTRKQKRRAIMKGLESSFTTKQWDDCKSFFDGRCAYCGCEGDMTQDHFIPVVKGGEYSRDNILPVCSRCNSHKREQDFFEWYPQQEFYLKLREKMILKYLNYKGVRVQQRTLFS